MFGETKTILRRARREVREVQVLLADKQVLLGSVIGDIRVRIVGIVELLGLVWSGGSHGKRCRLFEGGLGERLGTIQILLIHQQVLMTRMTLISK